MESSHAVVDYPQAFRFQRTDRFVADDHVSTLAARDYKDARDLITERAGVRRLTPVECERLQAFPDGWTEPAGSDSARYRAMGNAVTVNVVHWILRRMVGQ